MTTGLDGARARNEPLACLAKTMLDGCCADHLDRALVLGEEVLARLTEVEVFFAPDEGVLHSLVASAAIAKELAFRHEHPQRMRAAALLDGALRLSLLVLFGEEALRQAASRRRNKALPAVMAAE